MEESIIMNNTYTVGIIGCGYWGPNLIRNFSSLNNCRVKTLCDLDKARLAHMNKLYSNIKTSLDADDIFNDDEISAVAIATHVKTHFELAKKSLLAGKHTFIEKPMASSVTQCKELVELADKKGLQLMVGHTFIYSSPVNKIKEIMDSGEIGDLLYINSRRLNLGLFQKDINVTWDLAPHDIAIIIYLLKEAPVSVNCIGRAHVNPGIEDVTNLILNFSNGKFVTIQSSWLDPHKVREMKFVGSKKMIAYDDTETLEKIKVYDKRVETPPHYDTFAEFHYSYHYGDMYSPYISQGEPLKVECQHFIDCIEKKTTCLSSGIHGMQVVQVLEASSKSLKKDGAKIDLRS
jgi:predicted dehydrogenase